MRRLKFVAQIESGQSPASDLVTEGSDGLPFLQGNAEFGSLYPLPRQTCDLAPKRAQLGDVLLSVRAPVGAINVADQAYGIGRGLCAIRPASDLDRRYCFYLLITFRARLNGVATGSTYDAVTAADVGRLPALLPDLTEQRAIAVFLDRETAKIDALVAKKHQLIGLLHEKRTAVIARALTKGLHTSSPMKDSGVEWFGEVPAHWRVQPLKALLRRNDSGVWGDDCDDDCVVVLRSTEQTVDGSWIVENPARRRLTTREVSQARLAVGDLVVTKSSGSELHIGKTSLVDESVAALNCCFSNFMQRLRMAQPNQPRFFWHLLNSPVAREQFVYLSSTTTGLGNLSGSILGAVVVAVAPEAEQRAIAAFLDREIARVDGLAVQVAEAIEHLEELRAALISAAVTGKIDVRNGVAAA